MPTYEYACEGCGNRYEKREGFDAPARQKCPRCKKAAQRVLFAPPVVFKGSGFYKTDNRGSSSGDTSSAGPSSEPATLPAAPADGHGHTHAVGGHGHDAPSAAPDTSTSTETAAAT